LTINPGTGLTGGGGPISLGGTASLALNNTGVTSGTYGSETQVSRITVDATGRITSASNVNISPGNGTITNAMLQNSSLTINPGTGLTGGGGPISLGGTASLALNNTGVTAGTYGSETQVSRIIVDATGRITSASNVNIPSGSGTVTTITTGSGLTGGTITTTGTISIANGGVTNNMLVNSSLNVVAGTGMKGGGNVSLGGSTTPITLDDTQALYPAPTGGNGNIRFSFLPVFNPIIAGADLTVISRSGNYGILTVQGNFTTAIAGGINTIIATATLTPVLPALTPIFPTPSINQGVLTGGCINYCMGYNSTQNNSIFMYMDQSAANLRVIPPSTGITSGDRAIFQLPFFYTDSNQ
jgi:hypothetical protein